MFVFYLSLDKYFYLILANIGSYPSLTKGLKCAIMYIVVK